jgi:hypothetical protein
MVPYIVEEASPTLAHSQASSVCEDGGVVDEATTPSWNILSTWAFYDHI